MYNLKDIEAKLKVCSGYISGNLILDSFVNDVGLFLETPLVNYIIIEIKEFQYNQLLVIDHNNREYYLKFVDKPSRQGGLRFP